MENQFLNEKPSSSNPSTTLTHYQVDRMKQMMNKHEKKADNIMHGIKEPIRLAPRIFETVKRKLSLGARILQQVGLKRILKQLFNVREGKKLLKASQCYLWTIEGPIEGLRCLYS